ncbi:hypothetical protein D4Q52_13475 [Rhodopseudomonas palustris]|uniref:Uncharacterized protein n=2 Tax=Rhodopseudomonas palustris TaxID=1076 RepID=A0A418VDC8_RHOPL|nr:hypothetical protein D4Q52_13475 [Rhodopseudomonas palustris]
MILKASRCCCAAVSAALSLIPISVACAGGWEQSRDWYIELKRAAKYARIAITGIADLNRIDTEQATAGKQLQAALQLPLPDKDKAVCSAAAKAVVDFIAAGKAGNMTGGPASYERQYARWDALSVDCLKGIQRLGTGG